MARVKFTRHLTRFFPTLGDKVTVSGQNVAEIVAALDEKYPGLAAYIVDDQGAVRRHVNIFIGKELIHDRIHLQDPVGENDLVYIFQSLSGG